MAGWGYSKGWYYSGVIVYSAVIVWGYSKGWKGRVGRLGGGRPKEEKKGGEGVGKLAYSKGWYRNRVIIGGGIGGLAGGGVRGWGCSSMIVRCY